MVSDSLWEPPPAFEEYRIVRPLGHGAMGKVYLAHDALLDRQVAIKFVGAQEVRASARERFFTEARAVARLSHPNVVAVHRVGEVRRRPYLVSEYVPGTALDQLVKPLPWPRVLKIGLGLAQGLAAAHRHGVLHRDIKPSNVMVGDGDQAKLLDFGLAKLLHVAVHAAPIEPLARPPRGTPTDGGVAATQSMVVPAADGRTDRSTVPMGPGPAILELPLTALGAIVGTPLYLAPESWRGEPASQRSDIYALGILLYELACGATPHAGLPFAELSDRAQHVDAAPLAPRAAGLPPALGELIHACISRDPAGRPGSADAICERLAALAALPQSYGTVDGVEQPPFRGLAPFTEADRGRLYGRDRELAHLAEQVLFRRTVVFTAPSGTGKTSLLRAGLVPRLEGLGTRAVYVSCRSDPAATIVAALAPSTATIVDAIAAWRSVSSERLVIILDQLEALLSESSPDSSGGVLDELMAACGDDTTGKLDVSAVLAVREDFLARLLARGQRPPEGSGPIVRLGPIALDAAREAITWPLAGRGLRIEPELLEMLLSGLADTTAQLGRELGWGRTPAVYPPHLQLACSVLYDALAPGESTLTMAHYRRLGGLESIVGEHLDRVLATELVPDAASIARDLFLALVTASHSRAMRTESELLALVTIPDAVRRVPPILEVLRANGLVVRTKAPAGEAVWELVHDSLVPRVEGWVDRQDLARRRAMELVRHHLLRSTRSAPSLLSRAHLRELGAHSEALRELEAEWERRIGGTAADGEWTPQRLVARSRMVVRRRLAGVTGALCAVVALVGAAILDRQLSAAAQRREQSLVDRDLGAFQLDLAPFDWDAETLTPRGVAASDLPSLHWTLHEPDPDDPDSPGAAIGGSRLVRGEPFVSADGLTRIDPVEAPGGAAFLSIDGRGRRGDRCPPSIVPLRSVPGYASRRGARRRLRIRVPTCEATRADMIRIPAGPFISEGVGDPPSPNQVKYGSIERTVELPDYFLDRTEVTNGLFETFAEMAKVTGIATPTYADSDELALAHGADRPVASLGWSEARAFCRFLGRRLPTSPEWQKAFRGGLDLSPGRPNAHPRRNYPWGPSRTPLLANINRGVDVAPAAVGAFAGDVSPYGVLDLAGNVQEWTSSIDERGLRVTRGGNWAETIPEKLVDFTGIENPRPPGQRDYMIGLRCASD